MAFTRIGKLSGIPAGVALGYEIEGSKIAIANVGGKLYAFQDHCSHMGGRLSQGLLFGQVIMCPLHGSQFDVTSGEVRAGPANAPIRTFPVKVQGDDVLVDPQA